MVGRKWRLRAWGGSRQPASAFSLEDGVFSQGRSEMAWAGPRFKTNWWRPTSAIAQNHFLSRPETKKDNGSRNGVERFPQS